MAFANVFYKNTFPQINNKSFSMYFYEGCSKTNAFYSLHSYNFPLIWLLCNIWQQQSQSTRKVSDLRGRDETEICYRTGFFIAPIPY